MVLRFEVIITYKLYKPVPTNLILVTLSKQRHKFKIKINKSSLKLFVDAHNNMVPDVKTQFG